MVFTPPINCSTRRYTEDQIRYYLALLDLVDKPADFDFEKLDARNAFLAGRMNAAFERPISAVHSKFGGRYQRANLSTKSRLKHCV